MNSPPDCLPLYIVPYKWRHLAILVSKNSKAINTLYKRFKRSRVQFHWGNSCHFMSFIYFVFSWWWCYSGHHIRWFQLWTAARIWQDNARTVIALIDFVCNFRDYKSNKLVLNGMKTWIGCNCTTNIQFNLHGIQFSYYY